MSWKVFVSWVLDQCVLRPKPAGWLMFFGRRCGICRPPADLRSQNADKTSTSTLSPVCIHKLSTLNAWSSAQPFCRKITQHMTFPSTCIVTTTLHYAHIVQLHLSLSSFCCLSVYRLPLHFACFSTPHAFLSINRADHSWHPRHACVLQPRRLLVRTPHSTSDRWTADREFNGSGQTIALPPNPRRSVWGEPGLVVPQSCWMIWVYLLCSEWARAKLLHLSLTNPIPHLCLWVSVNNNAVEGLHWK